MMSCKVPDWAVSDIHARLDQLERTRPSNFSAGHPVQQTASEPAAVSTTPAATEEDGCDHGVRIETCGSGLTGVDKWLGGEMCADGNIFGIPGTGKTVLKVHTGTSAVSHLSFPHNVGKPLRPISSLKRGAFKWLRGILAGDGAIYGLPCNGNFVLKILPEQDEVQMVGDRMPGTWKWHGGVLDPISGDIYGIPANAQHVLKITIKTGEISLIGPALEGNNKWYGGLLGHDGCIYGIPYNADCVLKIDPSTDTISKLGIVEPGGWKWHGGSVASDGTIVGIPSHADAVLKIVPSTGAVTLIGGPLPSSTNPQRPHYKYKYGGGAPTDDGVVYAFPSDSDRVLKIVPASDSVEQIGPVFSERSNKWQNGFMCRDGCIYGIPCDAEAVLRIDPRTDQVSTVGLGPLEGKEKVEKWEGGVLGNDGVVYCMPQQSQTVLKIVPPAQL